ncbi:TA system antitoxin ParD family protein [Rhodococcus jostii]|uniref:TA system antitoxin ParD family protein n=1 Tax=Rhodococcus jostii TaxID=132919 RepID=UPI0035EC55B8
MAADLVAGATAEGQRQHRTDRLQLEHWARVASYTKPRGGWISTSVPPEPAALAAAESHMSCG